MVKRTLDQIFSSMSADAMRLAPQLSDLSEGSVIRSLMESFSAELSLLYEQLDLVYQSGFVDTASDANLDRVVAVLGIKRNEPDYATGAVTFTRDAGSTSDLTIPIGTLITTEETPDGNPPKKSYVTTQSGLMAAGKEAVDIPIQSVSMGRQFTSDGGTLIVMPRPVPGVKSVNNSDPIRFLGRDRETDDQLRVRAKQALLASGRASVTSIENALLGMAGVRDVYVEQGATPGVITVYVDGLTTDNSADIRSRIDEVRAAGIYATPMAAVPVFLDSVLLVDATPKLPAAERTKLEEGVRDVVINLVDSLRMGEPLLFSQLAAAVLKVSGVIDITRFAMSTFIEADQYAAGSVRLLGTPPSTVTIQGDTVIQTGLGQQFRLKDTVTFANAAGSVTADVVAVVQGRAGELLRTGTASNWNTLNAQGTAFTLENAEPIQLPRTAYELKDRLIPATKVQRITPNDSRAASQKDKPLPVRVQIALIDSANREAKRPVLEKAVGDFFVTVAGRADRSFKKDELNATLIAAVQHANLTSGSFDLRLVAFRFQQEATQQAVPQDDAQVDVSFVEKPEPEVVFVYTDRVFLVGSISLVLSLTAVPAQKNTAIGAARQAISDYLDSLGPEQAVSLDRIQQIAAGTDKVLRVDFQPEICGLEDKNGSALADRTSSNGLTVKAFEKSFLSGDKFVIQA